MSQRARRRLGMVGVAAVAVIATTVTLVSTSSAGTSSSENLARSPLSGMYAGTWFEGPAPIVSSLVGHESCTQVGAGFVCVTPTRVWTATTRETSREYAYSYPDAVQFEVRNTSSVAVSGQVTSDNSIIGLATPDGGSGGTLGITPDVFYAARRGGGCPRADYGAWRVAANSAATVCVDYFYDGAGIDALTARQDYLATVVFSGIAGWSLPSQRTSARNFNVWSPIQKESSGGVEYGSAWYDLGRFWALPCGSCSQDDLDAATWWAPFPSLEPLNRWNRAGSSPVIGANVVERLALTPTYQAGYRLAVKDVIGDGAFDCGASGCSLVRFALEPVPASDHVPGCGGGDICVAYSLPMPVTLVDISFLARATKGADWTRIVFSSKNAGLVQTSSLP